MAVNRYGNEASIYDFLPGNSGVWGDQGFSAGGSVPTTTPRPGMGAPGDRYRAALGLPTLDPSAAHPVGSAQWDSNKAIYVNPQSGQPFTGKLPSGQYATNGRVTGAPPSGVSAIDPNNAAQRYKPVDIIKSPDIAAGTADLLTTFKKNADASLKGFDDYLSTFKAASKGAFDKTNAATNIDPLAANLRGQQQQFSGALDKSAAEIKALNASDAAAQHGIVDRANALLPEMDTNAQHALDLGMGAVQKNISRYKAASGTPTSLGGAEISMQNAANRDLLVPFELAKTQRKMDILQGLELPIQHDLTNRETSRITQFDPMVAAQQFQSGTQTEQTIQGLKQAVAGMSWDNAIRYMQSIGVPEQIRQQILQGQVSTLGALSQLEDQSRYRGLQDTLGANLSQPQYYNMAQPGFPAPDRYSPVTGTPQGDNAPRQIGSTTGTEPAGVTAQDRAYFQQTGYWPHQDPNFSQAAYDRLAPAMLANTGGGGRYSNAGPQSNSYWDPNQGAYVDRTTGQITGWGPSGQSPYYDAPGAVTRG